MPIVRFSKKAVAALPPAKPGERPRYYDVEVPKLVLSVTARGVKTFRVIKRTGSKVDWITLGRFPDMSVDQAREAALEVLSKVAGSKSEPEARRAMKRDLTLDDFFKTYGSRHGAKKKSWKDDQQRYRDYLQIPLGNRKLNEITRERIADALHKAATVGRVATGSRIRNTDDKPKAAGTVRKIRALIRHMLRKAVEWGLLESNPAQYISVEGKSGSRDRFLRADELKRFIAAAAQEEDPDMRDFFLLAIFTGARRSNLLTMQWEEIDFNEAVWRIP
ncbi:MAG: integrase family protein, partial [Azoarcus sp.]|nr:integrase family protein [Azoarcus sp.]